MKNIRHNPEGALLKLKGGADGNSRIVLSSSVIIQAPIPDASPVTWTSMKSSMPSPVQMFVSSVVEIETVLTFPAILVILIGLERS